MRTITHFQDQEGFRHSYNLTLVEFERRLEEVKSDLKQEQERLRENCEKKFDSFERALEDLRSSFEKRARETEKQFEVVRLSFDSIEEDHLESKEEIKRHHTKSHEVFANQTSLDLEELQSDLLGEMLNLRGELANKTASDFAKVIQDVVQGYTEPIGRLEKAFEMQQQHIREALSHMGNQTETDFEELAVNLWKTLHSVERGIIDEFKYILTSTVDSAVQESSHKFESLSEHLEYFRKVSKNERQRIEDEISILESTWDPDTFGRLSKFLANTETFSDTMGKYWKRSGPNFYSFSKSSLSFDSAQAVCSSVGATLAEFPSTTEFTAFAQVCSLPPGLKPKTNV